MSVNRVKLKEITKLEVLATAQDLISDESHWTQKAFARDSLGKSITWSDPSAVCFCLHGAVAKSAMMLGAPDRVCVAAIGDLEKVAGKAANVAALNDDLSHVEVMQLLDKTMEGLS